MERNTLEEHYDEENDPIKLPRKEVMKEAKEQAAKDLKENEDNAKKAKEEAKKLDEIVKKKMADFKILDESYDKLQPKSDAIADWRSFQRAQKNLPHATEFSKKELEES